MGLPADVRPNRRGMRSRELVLDAAERLMAEEGFEAATLARVVEEAGIPLSSVYHYYGSKDGILLAVMERGAQRFFADLPRFDQRRGRPAEYLASVLSTAAQTLERHPNFLRLLIVYAVQPPVGGAGEVQEVVARVRRLALDRLGELFAIAFDDAPDSAVTMELARIALAAIDGAFVASQAEQEVTLEELLAPIVPAVVAIRRWLQTKGP